MTRIQVDVHLEGQSGQVSQECTCVPGPTQEPILEAASPGRTEIPPRNPILEAAPPGRTEIPPRSPILEAAPPCRTETPAPPWDQGHLRQSPR